MPVSYFEISAKRIVHIPLISLYIGIGHTSSRTLLIEENAVSSFSIPDAEIKINGQGRFTIREPGEKDFTGDLSTPGSHRTLCIDSDPNNGHRRKHQSFTYNPPESQ